MIKKSFIVFLFCATMMLGNVLRVTAAETPQVVNDRDTNDTLLEMGYPQTIINLFSQEEKQEKAEFYKKNPDAISVTSTTLEVDVLSEIDAYVNSTNEYKKSRGYTDEQIKETDKEIERYCNMTDDELKRVLNIDDDVTVKLMREVMKPDREYKVKDSMSDVTASGSITASEMTFSQAVKDYSSSSQANYEVEVSFWWNDLYFFGAFKDKVITAWGGNLTQYPDENNVYYYEQKNDWGSYDRTTKASYVESVINGGGYYQFPQTVSSSAKARSGRFIYDLIQNGKEGKTTKVITQYAHQMLTGSTSISISVNGPSVSVVPGSGYDTSTQLFNYITY